MHGKKKTRCHPYEILVILAHIPEGLDFQGVPVPAESPPAVMSTQPPRELALATEAARRLLVH